MGNIRGFKRLYLVTGQISSVLTLNIIQCSCLKLMLLKIPNCYAILR